MKSTAAAPASLLRARGAAPLEVVARVVACALSASLLLAVAVLVGRRAAGTTLAPLPTSQVIAVAGALVAIGIAGRQLRRSSGVEFSSAAFEFAINLAVATLVILGAAAICLPGASAQTIAGVCLLIAAGEGANWYLGRKGLHPRGRIRWTVLKPVTTRAPDVTQQMMRRIEPDGSDVVRGSVRLQFEPLQRTAVGHVAFCPPFLRKPECITELSGGPAGRVRVSHLYAYGARFEVRLHTPARDHATVIMGYVARQKSAAESAVISGPRAQQDAHAHEA